MSFAYLSQFRFAVLALSLGSAAAFAPVAVPKATTALAAKAAAPVAAAGYDTELGVQRPLGFWDPLGMVTNVDQERFDRLRGVELKHGRVSMLAFLGHVVNSNGYHFDGYLSTSQNIKFSDVEPGLAAFKTLPPFGTFQIILFIGWLEAVVMKDVTGTGEFVGDFRNDFIDFGWDKFTPEKKMEKRMIELNNGRAAQMGILGLMMHEVVGGKAYLF